MSNCVSRCIRGKAIPTFCYRFTSSYKLIRVLQSVCNYITNNANLKSLFCIIVQEPTTTGESLSIFFEPKCLVESTPLGVPAINQDVLRELQKLDKPVVVVVIAGPYRTGKSYLMNQLAGHNAGKSISLSDAIT